MSHSRSYMILSRSRFLFSFFLSDSHVIYIPHSVFQMILFLFMSISLSLFVRELLQSYLFIYLFIYLLID